MHSEPSGSKIIMGMLCCSGMLPGFVAGYYSFDECHVDLLRLCSLCGVQFVHATAKNIDPKVYLIPVLHCMPAHWPSPDVHHHSMVSLLSRYNSVTFILTVISRIRSCSHNMSLQEQKVILEGREAIRYDVLSIDVGITPSGQGIKGSLDFSTPVKPVSR